MQNLRERLGIKFGGSSGAGCEGGEPADVSAGHEEVKRWGSEWVMKD